MQRCHSTADFHTRRRLTFCLGLQAAVLRWEVVPPSPMCEARLAQVSPNRSIALKTDPQCPQRTGRRASIKFVPHSRSMLGQTTALDRWGQLG